MSTSPQLVLEKPDLAEQRLISRLADEFGLHMRHLAFLPRGADPQSVIYRVVTEDATPCFLKLRRGEFDETSVVLPRFLREQGVRQIIAPLATRSGQLWTTLDEYTMILYPFVEGRNAYEVELSDRQWVEFGAAVRRIHDAVVPPALAGRLQRETYSPYWRDAVRRFLAVIETSTFADPVAADLAAFLATRRAETLDLVGRAERRARALQAQSPDFVLCHSDLHAGNILITGDAAIYLVDWDNPILAPKERDLMFPGGGLFGSARTPQEEETAFYRGYGETQTNPIALAYYRYERIVQDIAVYCEQLLLSAEGGQDREQSLRYFKSNFLPGSTIDIAYQADPVGDAR